MRRKSESAPRGADGARLSIGALARATGIPIETLRTWEGRYGYPVPQRKPSGHRVYPLSSVARLKRIAQVLARGHRAAQVVAASDEALDQLLSTSAPGAPSAALPPQQAADPALEVAQLLALVEAFDSARLTHALLADWARSTPLRFLEARIAPLVRAVGDGWEAGRLQVRHEHFLSERVGDLLRSLRIPFEERAEGPLVVLATLPGEQHALGLQMAALVLAVSGCRVLFLGTEVPLAEAATLVRDLGAPALGVSVSRAGRGAAAREQLRSLRRRLPKRTALVVGGEGAPPGLPGVTTLASLQALADWARAVAR